RRPAWARRSARDLQARIALAPVLFGADRSRAAGSAEPRALPGRGASPLRRCPRSALARASRRQRSELDPCRRAGVRRREMAGGHAGVPVTDDLALSVILPVHDEAENLPILWREVAEVLPGLADSAEVIFVDDGSTDGSADVIRSLARQDPRIRLL